MADKSNSGYLERYPVGRIIPRWIFALSEMGLASSLVFDFGFKTGLLFLIYGFVGIFVILPLTRCIRCYYYGKVCNFGLGKWAAFFFPGCGPRGTTYTLGNGDDDADRGRDGCICARLGYSASR